MKERLAFVCLAIPAMAAAQAPEAVSQNNDQSLRSRSGECSAGGTSDEVVVCGRRDRGEQYRLPLRQDRFDPGGPVASVSRERNQLLEIPGSGLGSCTNVGPGGMTGCLNQQVWRQREQHGR